MSDPIRPITADEESLMTHVSMWGSSGYPVHKLSTGRGWTWEYRSIQGPPVVLKTKRAATESFEAFMEVLRRAKGATAQRDAIRRLLAQGRSHFEVASCMEVQGAGSIEVCQRLVELAAA